MMKTSKPCKDLGENSITSNYKGLNRNDLGCLRNRRDDRIAGLSAKAGDKNWRSKQKPAEHAVVSTLYDHSLLIINVLQYSFQYLEMKFLDNIINQYT